MGCQAVCLVAHSSPAGWMPLPPLVDRWESEAQKSQFARSHTAGRWQSPLSACRGGHNLVIRGEEDSAPASPRVMG